MPPPQDKLVLFIDDEPHHCQYYIDALRERGHEVVYRQTADEGRRYLEEHAGEVDAVVLDMMMPTPSGVSIAATDDGQITGIWLLLQVRQVIEDGRIPVVVLTNKQRAALVEQINEKVAPLNWKLVVKTKTEVRARDLPGEIDQLF